MLISYKRGQGSIILRVKILDSSVTTGAGLAGLTKDSAGLIIAAIADNEAATTAYTQAAGNIEDIATLGVYAAPTAGKCRFKEVDATNHPGVYEIQLADTRYAISGAKSLLTSLSGAANCADADCLIPLWDFDPYADIAATIAAALVAYGANKTVPDEAGTAAGLHATTNNKIDAIRTGAGSGDIPVNHDYGGTDALAYKDSDGAGIDDALVRAYLATDWEDGSRGNAYVIGQTRTTAAGRWEKFLMLDPGDYVLMFYKAGAFGPDLVSLTVE